MFVMSLNCEYGNGSECELQDRKTERKKKGKVRKKKRNKERKERNKERKVAKHWQIEIQWQIFVKDIERQS